MIERKLSSSKFGSCWLSSSPWSIMTATRRHHQTYPAESLVIWPSGVCHWQGPVRQAPRPKRPIMSPMLAYGCSRRVVLAMLVPGGPRPAATDSDYGLQFKFRVTVTVTARFKFLAVPRDCHAGTSLGVRGHGSLMDSDRAPRCGLDGGFHCHCSTWQVA